MRQHGLKILGEAILLIVVGLGLGLSANASSDDGIQLSRNHFPTGPKHARPPAGASQAPRPAIDSAASLTPDSPENPAAAGDTAITIPDTPAPPDQQLPYQTINHEDVVNLYTSPEYEFGQYIIIDARDDNHYQEGHVPGAYQLDHYRLEQYLPAVLPVCQSASRIVVYCNGGKCEDSELAAIDLMDAGIDPNKLFVYLGGAVEWTQAGLPLERGEHLSQDLYYPHLEEE